MANQKKFLAKNGIQNRTLVSGITSGTITPTADITDHFNITGLTGAVTISAPSGDSTDGQILLLKIQDDGTARAISWITTSGGYRVINCELPTTTTVGSATYVKCIYNQLAGYWDIASVNTINTSFKKLSVSSQLTLTNASNYNLYASGTGANYLAGKLGVGTTPFSDTSGISIGSSLTGGTIQHAANVYTTVASDVTNTATGYRSVIGTAAATFTLNSIQHFVANQLTSGAGSSVSSQYGFLANNSLTGAVNNYGFYGVIASGTGRYNLYMAGTADNYLAGSLGIGSTTLTGFNLNVQKNLTGGVTAANIASTSAIQSDVTAQADGYSTFLLTAAAAFTLTNLNHYRAAQGTLGAGSAVTSQFGFNANASLTGATNNYGFFGDITAAVGRYNLYMNGTADNYLKGKLQVDNYLLINYGSTQYSGMSIRNIYGNATRKGTSFLDFQNESAIATGHIFCNHEADGSSTFILGNTPPGAKTSDRRRECLLIDGDRNLKLMGATTGTSAVNVLAMPNGTAPTTSPTGVGQIYIEAGALKYRGASGTVTTLAPA
jgi:hypothetical protein